MLLPPTTPPADTPPPGGDQDFAEILHGDAPTPRVRVEQARARLTFYDQYGRGYQSKAGPPAGPGSERLWVIQPAASLSLRQRDERFSHDVTMLFDIVSAASPDALDVVSSASRYNEAGTLDVTSSVEPNARDEWGLRYGVHLEEHWRTGFGGLSYSADVNDKNTNIATSFQVVYDSYDDRNPRGQYQGQAYRLSLNPNVSITHILSRTTLASLSYGLTHQQGTLENGWNSIYISDAQTTACADDPAQKREYDCDNRGREKLPHRRLRHAISGQLNQHIPRTRSTFKIDYRHYRDDFGLRAHTVRAQAYQWLGRRLYLRFDYRLHHQTGVDFSARSITQDALEQSFATADSDLQQFFAHQVGAKAV
ncbi:MAG: DUF3570 domain-containing protein, partial [Myxococcales bacterium]|nr:DUF3570 domain-containing protein [Myxococcales bacterium]